MLAANGFDQRACYGQTYELHCRHTKLGPGTGFHSAAGWLKDDKFATYDENFVLEKLNSTTTCLKVRITETFQNGSFCCLIIANSGTIYQSRHVAPSVLCK